jgi:hypothetical protein
MHGYIHRYKASRARSVGARQATEQRSSFSCQDVLPWSVSLLPISLYAASILGIYCSSLHNISGKHFMFVPYFPSNLFQVDLHALLHHDAFCLIKARDAQILVRRFPRVAPVLPPNLKPHHWVSRWEDKAIQHSVASIVSSAKAFISCVNNFWQRALRPYAG